MTFINFGLNYVRKFTVKNYLVGGNLSRYHKLILIDDEVDLGENLKELFDQKFEIVMYFSNPEAALEEILKDDVNLIISDIKMPNLTGEVLVQKVRSNGILAPIIFLSGFVSKEMYSMALRLGVSDVFDKPMNFPYMLESIDKILEIEKRKREYILHAADPNYPADSLKKEKKLLGLLHVVNSMKLKSDEF
jgi:DNA-binding NtrC family response regulator